MTDIILALAILWVVYALLWPKRPAVVYNEYIWSEEWKQKALRCKLDANQICKDCKQRFELWQLQAHHLTYKRLGREWKSDLVCLCGDCHRERHGIE